MENRETPLPIPATDMTVKLFRAMSKASWDQVRRLYLVAFAGIFADQQMPEPEPYRDRTLVMLMHLEDRETWKKIYTTVKALTNEAQGGNMENRIEKKTVSTVDMTTEVFKAMSQGSASSIRCLYQIAFSGRLLPKQKPE